MKKAFIIIGLLAIGISVMAGGIVHNTNQSASFIRMPARDASFGIDAVYFNPAGLTSLKNGLHFSISNQYITQTRNIESTFPGMNRTVFEGTVVAPLFPSVYAAYKKDRLAISLGFNPIGGGGGALFEEGLPSFEMQPSTIPAALTAGGVPTTAYSFDTRFEGKSVFYGFQGGISYRVHDQLSLSVGARYVTINNSYSGYLRNIQINPNRSDLGFDGSMRSAPGFFTEFSGILTNLSQTFQGAGQNLQPIIESGYGGILLENGAMVQLTPEQIAFMQGAITQLGGNPQGMTIAQTQQFFFGASAGYAANSTAMSNNAHATRDLAVEATQTGSGITPIIGMNMQFTENFNISVKYEFRTKINVTNETEIDDVGLYPDKEEVPSDMPAMLSVGMQWRPTQKLALHLGMHNYFDRVVKYGRKVGADYVQNNVFMDSDFVEVAFGVEYSITDKLLISAGYLATRTGVNENYQTDLSHSLSTNSLGGGFRYNFSENFGVNLGVMNTWYIEDTRDFGLYKEIYNRKAFVAAIGVDFSL